MTQEWKGKRVRTDKSENWKLRKCLLVTFPRFASGFRNWFSDLWTLQETLFRNTKCTINHVLSSIEYPFLASHALPLLN